MWRGAPSAGRDGRGIDDALREVRLTLMKADINFKVVKDYIAMRIQALLS